ncbi:MAG TPA: mandelate racemase/muconate lactonizing enzyme family protein, partial [Candidatus Wunengus sp. YC61]|uniref:mandelate racemase/muconate lactonizing enzyme family protein n=1 Tax=Candidatus Wunengus sp. YC61 TaxID=3367698 RepID=UPI0040280BFE
AGLPVYKLLGGKVRDKVRVYNGGVRFNMGDHSPQDYAENIAKMNSVKEGFTILKHAVGYHSAMPGLIPNMSYAEVNRIFTPTTYRGPLTEHGLKHVISCIEAMKAVLGDKVGLALDCGPGWTVSDAIRLAKAVEPLNLMWLEDLITGDYTPYVLAELYREVTRSTSTPIHTGEEIYLRQNFKALFEMQAVRVVGPDPCDVGGLAELKWVAEFADLHGIQIAPHGVANGVIGMAALVQVCATLPHNYIAFEYPIIQPMWYDIVDWMPDPIVKDGFIEVWDRPGLGIGFNEKAAKKYLAEEDIAFFD